MLTFICGALYCNMIEDETPLLLHVIADCVLGEARSFAPEFNFWGAAQHLCDRAEHCFAVNKTFRRKTKGARGREHLYMFMRHWLAAWMIDEGFSRQEMNERWMNGLKI